MKKIFWALIGSHSLFICSGITYSLFWIFQESTAGSVPQFLLGCAFLFGMGGVLLAGTCIKALVQVVSQRKLKLYHIVLLCLGILGVTSIATSGIMGRLFTSELPLVVLWAGLEWCAILLSYYRNWLSIRRAFVSAISIAIALGVGLFCYSMHYIFEGSIRFYNGLVPYAVISLVTIVLIALLLGGLKNIRTTEE